VQRKYTGVDGFFKGAIPAIKTNWVTGKLALKQAAKVAGTTTGGITVVGFGVPLVLGAAGIVVAASPVAAAGVVAKRIILPQKLSGTAMRRLATTAQECLGLEAGSHGQHVGSRGIVYTNGESTIELKNRGLLRPAQIVTRTGVEGSHVKRVWGANIPVIQSTQAANRLSKRIARLPDAEVIETPARNTEGSSLENVDNIRRLGAATPAAVRTTPRAATVPLLVCSTACYHCAWCRLCCNTCSDCS
jgi:hypothetical protein